MKVWIAEWYGHQNHKMLGAFTEDNLSQAKEICEKNWREKELSGEPKWDRDNIGVWRCGDAWDTFVITPYAANEAEK